MYYHGTKALFEQFSKEGGGKHGRGYYFTPDYNEACHFAYTLAGDGSSAEPKVYHVELSHSNLFNTMNIDHCKEVASRLGFSYHVPRSAGGPKEHYHHLAKQLKQHGISEDLNKELHDLGFDGIIYDLMEHVILFKPDHIKIIKVEKV